MSPEQILEMFRRFAAQNPHPETELKFSSEFELLVAVILSAQATDKRVNLVTPQLFAVANTPAKLFRLGEKHLKDIIKSIGLYQSKAKNLIATAKILAEDYQGKVPNNRVALEALPGVGRKTANVILNTLFGENAIAVDTHIFRVSNRTGLAPGKTVRQVEKLLMKRVPLQYQHGAHHWLVLHGRYICVARKPKCGECLIRDLCHYPNKTI
ncbi:MAG: endonuclease III [Gammaproteobacteria bacterium]